MINQRRRINISRGLILVAIFFIVLLGLSLDGVTTFQKSDIDIPNDFFTFWLASRMVYRGDDPYDSSQWIKGHEEFQANFIANDTFLYPIPLAILLPIGFLPVKSAYVAWGILSFVMIVVSIIMLIKAIARKLSLSIFLLILVGVLLFRGTITSLMFGQIAPLLLLIIAVAAWMWSRNYWILGGVIISLVLLKPSIGVPFISLVVVGLLLIRRWLGPLGIISGSFALLSIGFLYDPSWVIDYLSIIFMKGSHNLGYSPTLWGLAGTACNHKNTCTLQAGVILTIILFTYLIYIAVKKRSQFTPFGIIALAITASILITPYLWAYDHILCLISPIMISIAMERKGVPYILAPSLILILDLVALFLLVLAFRVGSDALSAFIPAIVLVFTARYFPILQSQDLPEMHMNHIGNATRSYS